MLRRTAASTCGLALFATLGLLAPAGASGCPDPRTCPTYTAYGEHWWPDDDGISRINYYVNPYHPFGWVPPQMLIDATRAAFDVWEAYNPNIKFIYRGTTDRPAIPNDGMNVISFIGPTPGESAITWWRFGGRNNSEMFEADTVLYPLGKWVWNPCELRDDSCTSNFRGREWQREPRSGAMLPALGVIDLVGFLVHEFGHWLALYHASGEDSRCLTMTDQINCETPPNGTGEDDRHMVTLGLGDVLGAKFLYPWTCPNPSPDGSYPARYRLLCPSVQIFVP